MSFLRCTNHDRKDFTTWLKERVRREGSSRPRKHSSPKNEAPQPPDPLLGAAQDEEGLDAVLLEVGVALAPTARLHLVVSIQVVECGLGDVDASTGEEGSGRGRQTENVNSELELPMQNPTATDSITIQMPGP